ncbi:hypothetical protein HDU86_006154 [Geranomyces michiganensis]|nr:hypothetical protein HDU86_006154 [Geranomyces michiganensis]
MFGCIVAGRLYVFDLEDPESINHIVAFMTGVQAFPPGFAATVHFLWPSKDQWQFLGILSNEKPSAIYRLGGNKKITSSSSITANDDSGMMLEDDNNNDAAGNGTTLVTPGARSIIPAKLGISVEPIEAVAAQVNSHNLGAATTTTTAGTPAAAAQGVLVKNVDPVQLTTKILESLYNYCSSFAGPLPAFGAALFGGAGMDWGSTFIPLRALQDWFGVMQRKLKADPSGSSLLRQTD